MRDNALSHLFHFYVNLARKSYQNSKMFSRGSGPRERETQKRRTSICRCVTFCGQVSFLLHTHTHTHRPKIVGDPEWQLSFKSKNFNELWKTLKFSKGKKKPIHKNNNSKPDSHDKYLSIKRCYSSIEAPLQTFYCFRTLENSEG